MERLTIIRQVTFADYKNAVRDHRHDQPFRLRDNIQSILALAAMLVSLGLGYWPILGAILQTFLGHPFQWRWSSSMTLSIVLLFAVTLLAAGAVRQTFWRSASYRDFSHATLWRYADTVTFSEDGIRFSNTLRDVQYCWAYVACVVAERDTYLILWADDDRGWTFIPRGAITKVDDQEMLRRIVATHSHWIDQCQLPLRIGPSARQAAA